MENKFKIGDIVTNNNNFGPNTCGEVVGIVTGPFWLKGIKKTELPLWDKFYPGWLNKPVYYVKLPIPTKSVTYEEFLEWQKTNAAYSATYDIVPVVENVVYPEDDLNLLEDKNVPRPLSKVAYA